MKKKNPKPKKNQGDGIMDRWWVVLTNPNEVDENDNLIPQVRTRSL